MEKLTYWLHTLSEFLENHDGAITAIATVFIAFFTIALARSTKKLWKETKAASVTAEKAANAAMKSADAAEHGLRLAERPNLRIDQWGVTGLIVGQKPNLTYKLINSGRSQAEIVEVLGGYGISSEDKVPDAPLYHKQEIGTGIAFSGASIDMSIGLIDPLTTEEFNKVKIGENFIFLFGKITAIDQFNWTCEIAYGAQYGNLGEGEFGVTFMKRPGYNFVRWTPP